jgi:hypothetical protein
VARLLQVLLYGLFAVAIAYFSTLPRYETGAEHLAVVKLSLSHAAQRAAECVTLTPDQIAELAASGKRLPQCERTRLPLLVQLEIDGEIVYQELARPSGLWSDGPASVYRRFDVSPGRHTITARLRDSAREQGWDYTHSEVVSLVAGRYFTVTFRAETGGFRFR